MEYSKKIAVILGSLVLLIPVFIQAADIPVPPYVEVFFPTSEPMSLFCLPDGGGKGFTEANNGIGETVDGTMTMVLYSEAPPWGNPVPNFPREDLWLMDELGQLAICNGGSIPDSNTDANGTTTWTLPLKLGGHAEPGTGNRLFIWVIGWELHSPALDGFRLNSADLDGSGVVNLSDIALFTQGYYGAYDYSYDFRWDGVINLSDLALMASSIGAACP